MKDISTVVVFAAPLGDAARAKNWQRGLALDEQERAERFVDPVHCRRFVLRRWILRCVLGMQLGSAPESLTFRTNAFGKPTLAPPFDRAGLFYSASHSCDLAIIGVRRGKSAFAVDVEQVRTFDDADQIVARFFSPSEQQEYCALAPADRQEAFWRGWTVKEAFIKALGFGLSFPLDQFDVALHPDHPPAIGRVQADTGEKWEARIIEAGPEFRGALVGRDLRTLVPRIVPEPINLDALPSPCGDC
ncbi:MAG: 4'-phosphopantetheinyl transferase superfamily protein [Xanthobacteraceae bacterium]